MWPLFSECMFRECICVSLTCFPSFHAVDEARDSGGA